MLVLRNLGDEDVVLMKKWLEQEFISKWFGDASDWLLEIEHRNDEFNFIKHFIVEKDGVPVGFCQYYDWNKAMDDDGEPEGTCGIDYMIGEESLLGKGYGKNIVRLICDKVIENRPDTVQIIADPSVEEEKMNIPSIKVLEANEFQYDPKTELYKKQLNV